MLHGQDRELEAHHPAHFTGPQAAGVDDVLRMDRVAVLDQDVPRPVRTLRQPRHQGVLADLRAGQLGTLHVGAGDAGRIDVTLDPVVQRTDEVLGVHHREEVPGLGWRDHLEFHPEVAAPGDGHAEEVHPVLRVGQHQPAAEVDRAALAGDLLDLLVEVDRVLLEARDVRVAVEGVHAAGRVPRRACGELAAFEKHDILPARLRQVVQDARADDSTADDDSLELVLHRSAPLNSRSGRHPRLRAGRQMPRAPRRRPGPSAAVRTMPAVPSRCGLPSTAAPGNPPPPTSRSCASH